MSPVTPDAAMPNRSQGTDHGSDQPPRPLTPRRAGPRFATPAERALAAEWCLREYTRGRRQFDIAVDLGVSQSTVSDLISQAIRERKGLAVDELRQVRSDTYRELIATLAPHALKTVTDFLTGEQSQVPDLDVIARMESLTDKLARLEGSVAPTQVTVSKGGIDARLEELAEQLHARGVGTPVPTEA